MRVREKTVRRGRVLPLAIVTVVAIAMLAVWVGSAAAVQSQSAFDRAGNVLIADQFNNRVIETAQNGRIVWHFGNGSSDAGAHAVVAPNDAQRIPGGRTLIAATGAPAGAPATPPVAPPTAAC